MLLSDPLDNPHLLMTAGQLQPATWKLPSIDSRQKEFQVRLCNCWQQDGAEAKTQHMKMLGGDGIADALNGKVVPTQHMKMLGGDRIADALNGKVVPTQHMKMLGGDRITDALNGKVVPFYVLFSCS